MKILFFYFFIFLYLFSTNASITTRCPPDTIKTDFDDNTCYLFVNNSKKFDEAENFCNEKGGNLAAVAHMFANQFISYKADEKFRQFDTFWIGGIKKTVKMDATSAINVWGWTKDDRLMTFSDWDPTSTSKGNCTGVQTRGLWSASDCSLKNPFVCQIPADLSYCDDGWTYYNFTNFCYKKFSVVTPISHPAAENLCIQKGGHLVSIHSALEDQFICDLTSIGYYTDEYASRFWIGGKRNDNSSNWYWTDNSTFNYANWGHLCDYAGQFCSDFWPDKTKRNNFPMQWNAANCTIALNDFLCKKLPDNVPMD